MNNIPQGYKQTELGIIPEDWTICKICDGLADVKSGKRLPMGYYVSENRTAHPYIRVIDMYDGGVDTSNILYVPEDAYPAIEKYCIFKDDIFISVAGSLGIVGKIPEKLDGANLTENANKLTSISCNRDYLLHFLRSPYIQRVISSEQTIGAQPKLALARIRNFEIILPDTQQEQNVIAEALSDVDALITALDRKIAKKRLIKQGAMQQLLTGNMRLAGFSDPWVEKKIYEIGVLAGSGVDKKNIAGEQSVRLVNFLDVFRKDRIFNKDLQFWTTASDVKIKTCNVLQGDIFFTPSSEMPYDIALSAVAMENMNSVCYSYHIYRFRLLEDIDLQYRAYMFKSSSFYEQANVACEGSGKRYVISLSKFNNLTIYYPTDKQEQHAIAAILSDMDKEIADLEVRRDKYKLIKSGMMQKLLTGQIRLVKPLVPIIPLEAPDTKIREIPLQTHIVAGHIVNTLYQSLGWGRTKLQKTLHLVGYHCQLDFGNEYIRNTAGPDDQTMMNHIDSKFKQYRHVKIEAKKDNGKTRYNYIPTAMIDELEQVYETYPQRIRDAVDSLINKIKKMDLAGAEILSTLYAVWNNRLIKGEPITDNLLVSDFYAWSAHKADFEETRVRKALDYMRKENIIPVGWGKYIDKK